MLKSRRESLYLDIPANAPNDKQRFYFEKIEKDLKLKKQPYYRRIKNADSSTLKTLDYLLSELKIHHVEFNLREARKLQEQKLFVKVPSL